MTGTGFARRIRNGKGANVLRQVINIGSELMLVPILLVAWGNHDPANAGVCDSAGWWGQ